MAYLSWMYKTTILLSSSLNIHISIIIPVTQSSGPSGTEFIDDTGKPKNIKIYKYMKSTILKNIFISNGNYSDLSNDSREFCQRPSRHREIEDLRLKMQAKPWASEEKIHAKVQVSKKSSKGTKGKFRICTNFIERDNYTYITEGQYNQYCTPQDDNARGSWRDCPCKNLSRTRKWQGQKSHLKTSKRKIWLISIPPLSILPNVCLLSSHTKLCAPIFTKSSSPSPKIEKLESPILSSAKFYVGVFNKYLDAEIHTLSIWKNKDLAGLFSRNITTHKK